MLFAKWFALCEGRVPTPLWDNVRAKIVLQCYIAHISESWAAKAGSSFSIADASTYPPKMSVKDSLRATLKQLVTDYNPEWLLNEASDHVRSEYEEIAAGNITALKDLPLFNNADSFRVFLKANTLLTFKLDVQRLINELDTVIFQSVALHDGLGEYSGLEAEPVR